MKKILLCLALVIAVSLIGLVSAMRGQVQVQPQKPTVQRAPTPELKVADPRLTFGEKNNTAGSAYLLHAFAPAGRLYKAGFHSTNDVDYYQFKAPSKGFGSWFSIDVRSIEPHNFQLYVELLGPQGDVLESAYVSSGNFWIALKSGVATKVKITPGDPWDGDHVYYDIGLTFGLIPDALEVDDTPTQAATLTYGGTRTAYMCGVLDSAGETIGLDDWFQYEHRSCRNDCISVSKSAYLEICKSPAPDDCSGCSNEGTRVCVSDGCEGGGWGPSAGPRYILLRPFWSDDLPYGQGTVPDYYKRSYTIRLLDTGPATFDEDCTNP
jgi:hypothetical protein